MKAFPTDSYADAENGAPYIEYSIVTKQAGDYEAEFYMQPSNPVTTENRLQYAVSVNGVPMQILDAVTDDFKIGDHQPVWARGVLDQIRRRSVPVQLEQGINTIRVTPVTPGFVLEKIVIYPHGNKTGRSLSWTDRNVSVQELIIYQYSEEHVSPFCGKEKFGMG